MDSEDTIKKLEVAIQVVNSSIDVTNSFLDKKSWKYKRNEMTKHDVEKCLKQQILKLKSLQ